MGAGWQRWWQDESRYRREIEEARERVRNDDVILGHISGNMPGWNARIIVDDVEEDLYRGPGKFHSKR